MSEKVDNRKLTKDVFFFFFFKKAMDVTTEPRCVEMRVGIIKEANGLEK